VQLTKAWLCPTLRLTQDSLRSTNSDFRTSSWYTPSRPETQVVRHTVLDGYVRLHVAGQVIDSGRLLYPMPSSREMVDGGSASG
jgi:hypothetical protein